MRRLLSGPLLVALNLLPLAACREPPAREMRVVMGTTAEVRAVGLPQPMAGIEGAFAALDAVDGRMSLWQESELKRLNAAGEAAISPELTLVLQRALDVAAASDGAFDPTVEPLVRAAGRLDEPRRELDPASHARLLSLVGASRVHLDVARRRVRLEPGTRLDLGGIAKGYAVDRALAALRAAGARKGMVNLGGSSLALFGETISVAVRDPERADAPRWGSFDLTDAALASSGGDQRPAHVFDPRTGQPARVALAATVVASSGMEADALATALFVLGADAGLELVARRGAAGLVLLREGGRRVIRCTPGFVERYKLEAPGVDVREGRARRGAGRL